MITNTVVNQAITYIMKHIGEEISIEDVAKACHFSKYYFSRVFKAETGESIYAFIKRVKMDQSAFRLKVDRNRSITDIGFDYGYSPSNYSSVFKQHHNTSPVKFRKDIYERSLNHPNFPKTVEKMETFEECNQKITIETCKEQTIIYERRIGNYHNLALEWNAFFEKYKDYVTEHTMLIERTFDDPSITDVDSCLYDIGMSVDADCPLMNTGILQGGKYAVYHFLGHPEQIYYAYQGIFNSWFPNTDYEIDERYGFDVYRKVDCDTMLMDIDFYFPIK